MRNKKYFWLSGLFSTLLAMPLTAHATFQVWPASGCSIEGDNAGDYLSEDNGGEFIENNSSGVGARPRIVHCPVPSNSTIGSQNLTGADAWGIDNSTDSTSGSVILKVCYELDNGTAAGCSTGAATSATGTGAYDLNPTGPASTTNSGMWVLANKVAGYLIELQITLPAASSGDSTIIGYNLSSP